MVSFFVTSNLWQQRRDSLQTAAARRLHGAVKTVEKKQTPTEQAGCGRQLSVAARRQVRETESRLDTGSGTPQFRE